jgi:hypothetical protein
MSLARRLHRPRLRRYGTTPAILTAHRVHLVRTLGMPDAWWGRYWRLTTGSVRDARVGKTWRKHPTPPDTAPRAHLGNWGDLSDTPERRGCP